PLGQPVTGGQYNLGPVDWAETQWHNSCAPYPPEIQALDGDFLAGTDLAYNGNGQLCDACIQIVTAQGKSVVARVVTTGVSNMSTDLDLSPQAYAALNVNEYPRSMTWRTVTCPTGGPLYYQWQTGANVYWTSLWVRNPRVAITKLEVMSKNHATWF